MCSKRSQVSPLVLLLLLLHHTTWTGSAAASELVALRRRTLEDSSSSPPPKARLEQPYAGPAAREDEARKEKGLGSTSSEAAARVCFKCNNSLCSEVSWASNWCLSLWRRWYMARRACASERCEDSFAISSCPPSRSRHELQKTDAHV